MTTEQIFLEKIEANFRPDGQAAEAREKRSALREARRDDLAALLELETAARLLEEQGDTAEWDAEWTREQIDTYSKFWNIKTGGNEA